MLATTKLHFTKQRFTGKTDSNGQSTRGHVSLSANLGYVEGDTGLAIPLKANEGGRCPTAGAIAIRRALASSFEGTDERAIGF